MPHSSPRWKSPRQSFLVVAMPEFYPCLTRMLFRSHLSLLKRRPPIPTASELSQAIERIAALFLALERPPTRTVQGFWGELFLIATSKQPVFLVEAWHTQASEHYDFAAGVHRLEVKTSGDRSRNHHFSTKQILLRHMATHVAVASMFTERGASGPTLGELGTRHELKFRATCNSD